jgi:hypothetical protein
MKRLIPIQGTLAKDVLARIQGMPTHALPNCCINVLMGRSVLDCSSTIDTTQKVV